jgi:glutamate synthase domain-containing protein 1
MREFESKPAAAEQGLYDPAQEHDACGVGFVANLRGEKSHLIVQSGLEILVNLTHRGACGCDPLTGDGAGILTQIPDGFFRAECAQLGFELPAAGDYGIGSVFLPQDLAERRFCEQTLEKFAVAEGQRLLGWRDIPIDNSHIGQTAREVEPFMRQVFIARGEGTPADMFQWKLYVIRKQFESTVKASDLTQKKYAYVPSL